ncbi:uncharacterized protein STEHIDRAFT_152970 [Stereum hirsutum FP-91666 SS1]|uniref:uncharacterized protein n=1 Tax=Stereum hirsutum (strain FP-91666) TaxID=721885 RepID=UPI000440B86A|nr:uncharacterized protein STEHIDRAFT_152970 [Stereum hirsutum FP-91666 SS1]EIM91322.1 hypothetical protein STEHIDRAFT_152970 [Stereum hirsutum FP-91666 SS1]
MATSIPHFAFDGQVRLPSSALLSVACTCVRSLHSHYETRRRDFEAANNEDGDVDAVESLGDVEHTVREIDPAYWQELLSTRFKSSEIPAQRVVSEQQRISNLLAIGRVPKAEFVIAEAVQRHRETRDGKVDKDAVEKEDVLLDFLVFLAGKRERAALFSVAA